MATFEELRDKNVEPSYQLLIEGKWVDALDGKTFNVTCPNNGEFLSRCANASEADVDLAVKAAWKAYPAWKATSYEERATLLNKAYDKLREVENKMAWADALEVGKLWTPIPTLDSYRYYAACIRNWEGIANTIVDHRLNVVLNEPIGVVGQISAWNGPLVMACMKIPPALAAGNCVIYRPSKHTPIGTLIMAEALNEILPPGVFNVITGDSETCGQAILDHPGIRKISFTGSTDTGIKVATSAAKKLIPATLELGGKSAHIFFSDCDFEKAIQGMWMGIFFYAGEMCAAGSRILVQEDFYDKFLEASVAAAKAIKVGPVWDPEATMSGLIYESHLKKVLNYVEIGRKEGANIAFGGHRLMDGELAKGCFMEPTILEGNNKMRIAQEEIFGPTPVFIKFKTEEEAIAIANDSAYGLAGGVWTRDINRAIRVARGVETGSMWVNTYNQMFFGYPFGGYKNSGYGRELHKSTLDHFSQKKSIVLNLSETEIM